MLSQISTNISIIGHPKLENGTKKTCKHKKKRRVLSKLYYGYIWYRKTADEVSVYNGKAFNMH